MHGQTRALQAHTWESRARGLPWVLCRTPFPPAPRALPSPSGTWLRFPGCCLDGLRAPGRNDKACAGSAFIFGTCMKSLEDERHFFYLNISRQLGFLIIDKGSSLLILGKSWSHQTSCLCKPHPPIRGQVPKAAAGQADPQLPLPVLLGTWQSPGDRGRLCPAVRSAHSVQSKNFPDPPVLTMNRGLRSARHGLSASRRLAHSKHAQKSNHKLVNL